MRPTYIPLLDCSPCTLSVARLPPTALPGVRRTCYRACACYRAYGALIVVHVLVIVRSGHPLQPKAASPAERKALEGTVWALRARTTEVEETAGDVVTVWEPGLVMVQVKLRA